MKLLYTTNTPIGNFYIGETGGRYHPIFEGQSLGSYSSAQQAAEDLAGGHTFGLPSGVDTSELGIPDNVFDWERLP